VVVVVVVVVMMMMILIVRRRRGGEAVSEKFNKIVFEHTGYCWILEHCGCPVLGAAAILAAHFVALYNLFLNQIP
jgi:hypothetical protein